MAKYHEDHPEYGAMGIFAGYDEFEEPADVMEEVGNALSEALLQIEYLHEKFGSRTGSGEAILSRGHAALAKIRKFG